MKEAAGEANMTVITIVLVGVVLAAAMIIIPKMLTNVSNRTDCMNNGGTWSSTGCSTGTTSTTGGTGGTVVAG